MTPTTRKLRKLKKVYKTKVNRVLKRYFLYGISIRHFFFWYSNFLIWYVQINYNFITILFSGSVRSSLRTKVRFLYLIHSPCNLIQLHSNSSLTVRTPENNLKDCLEISHFTRSIQFNSGYFIIKMALYHNQIAH